MKIVLFGAGKNSVDCFEFLKEIGCADNVVEVIDNDEKKIGEMIEFSSNRQFQIKKPQQVIRENPKALYWITPARIFRNDMLKQLLTYGIGIKQIHFFVEQGDLLTRMYDYRHYMSSNDGYVTAFIPIELCFTANIEDVPYHKNNEEHKYIYNAPIMKKKTLLDMYRMFMNGKAYSENMVIPEYKRRLESVKHSSISFEYLESVEKFTEHEYWHFHQMNEKIAKGDLKFFVDIAPLAKFNYEARVFNMLDGTHRAMLFYLHGFRYIPLKIKREDYDAFINMEKLGAVNEKFDICMKDELEELPVHAIPVGSFSLKYIYTPILHPDYYELFVSRESYYQSRMDLINEFFSFTTFENKRIIDLGSNISYIPQNFARQGAICDCIEYVKQRADLGKALTELYGLEKRVTIYNESLFDFCPKETYEIGIILAIYDHWSTKINSEGRDFLEKVDSLVDGMLIWESGNQPETEKANIIKYTKFKNYTRISYTFGTSKCRELGVFCADGYSCNFNI